MYFIYYQYLNMKLFLVPDKNKNLNDTNWPALQELRSWNNSVDGSLVNDKACAGRAKITNLLRLQKEKSSLL